MFSEFHSNSKNQLTCLVFLRLKIKIKKRIQHKTHVFLSKLVSFLYIFSRFMFCDYYRNRVVHIAINKHISLLAMQNLLTI